MTIWKINQSKLPFIREKKKKDKLVEKLMVRISKKERWHNHKIRVFKIK